MKEFDKTIKLVCVLERNEKIMLNIAELEKISRRELNVFYILDTSEEMCGMPIATLNNAMPETVEVLRHHSKQNIDILLKISVLAFNSVCNWITKEPEEIEDFIWKNLKAGGARNVGAALKELDAKLSEMEFSASMKNGAYLPIFIFITCGHATDDYKEALRQINCNKWFLYGYKIGIPIGEEADVHMLAEIAGTMEAVIQSNDLGLFGRMIVFKSVSQELLDAPLRSCLPKQKEVQKDDFFGFPDFDDFDSDSFQDTSYYFNKYSFPERVVPEKTVQEKAVQKKAEPKKGVQKKAEPKKEVQKKAEPEKAVQKKAEPKKAVQKKAVLGKIVQKNPTEKNTVPEKIIVEDTFQKALAEILLRSGKETLKNKKKLIAHLSDMAPTSKKEIHILNRSCSPTFLQMFCISDMQNTTLRQQTIGKARNILLDEEGLSESWTNVIVDALEYAVWGK